MIDAYVIYGNDSEPKAIPVPDDFFISHDRANGWRSCFPTYREARDFAEMDMKIKDLLKNFVTHKLTETKNEADNGSR